MPPQAPATPQAPAPTTPPSWADAIRAEAIHQGVPPELALAVAGQESSINPNTPISSAGAIGIMQLMPATAKRLGVDPTNPLQNIRGGVKELRRLLDLHNGDLPAVLREYNGSPNAPAAATDPYVRSVLGRLATTGRPPTASQSRAGSPTVGTPPPGSLPADIFTNPDATLPRPTIPEKRLGPPPIPDPRSLETGMPGRATLAAADIAHAGLENFNPLTPEGRQNLSGAAGATAFTLAFPEATALQALLAGVTGAAVGGETAEGIEQASGVHPPSTAGMFKAAGTQGAQELAGQALPWVTKAVIRRSLASTVGKTAHAALTGERATSTKVLEDAMTAASQGDLPVDQVRGETLAPALREPEGADATRVGLPPVRGTTAARDFTTRLVAQPPSAAAAGQTARAVLRGPAQEARDLLGQQVDEAARNGPTVDITPLKAEAQRIVEQLAKPARAFPRAGTEVEAAGIPAEAAAGFKATYGRSITEAQKDPSYATLVNGYLAQFAPTSATALEGAQDEAAREMLKHPAMGVINRILNADDHVSFYDAHLFKRDLDDALRGKWDQNPSVKKTVTSLTQHLRGELRDTLSGYEPYNEATAAYQKIVPLYDTEYAAKFRKLAATDPESLTRMISPKKPTAVRMLRDVLVGQSEVAGKGQEGRTAWNAVRATWTHDNILKNGFAGIDANLGKLDPEFSSVFYGDAGGKSVYQNLQTLGGLYKASVQRFAKSTIAGRQPSREEMVGDALRAALVGIDTRWGGISFARLLRGPAERDLAEWAAYSPARTRRWVGWVTGRDPAGVLLADMVRAGVPENVLRALGGREARQAIGPMPMSRQIGQPPPTGR